MPTRLSVLLSRIDISISTTPLTESLYLALFALLFDLLFALRLVSPSHPIPPYRRLCPRRPSGLASASCSLTCLVSPSREFESGGKCEWE
jgi:hypothetical protein